MEWLVRQSDDRRRFALLFCIPKAQGCQAGQVNRLLASKAGYKPRLPSSRSLGLKAWIVRP